MVRRSQRSNMRLCRRVFTCTHYTYRCTQRDLTSCISGVSDYGHSSGIADIMRNAFAAEYHKPINSLSRIGPQSLVCSWVEVFVGPCRGAAVESIPGGWNIPVTMKVITLHGRTRESTR